MAKRLPRPLHRRDMLYGPTTSTEKLVELGEAYLSRDLVFDAADFFGRARNEPGLKKVRESALEMGDAFLLRKVQEALPALVSDEDWTSLGARAQELGKTTYVERAKDGGTPPPPPLLEEVGLAPGEITTDEDGEPALESGKNIQEKQGG